MPCSVRPCKSRGLRRCRGKDSRQNNVCRLSAESGDDCGAAVPAAQKVGAQDGRRDARTTNLAESPCAKCRRTDIRVRPFLCGRTGMSILQTLPNAHQTAFSAPAQPNRAIDLCGADDYFSVGGLPCGKIRAKMSNSGVIVGWDPGTVPQHGRLASAGAPYLEPSITLGSERRDVNPRNFFLLACCCAGLAGRQSSATQAAPPETPVAPSVGPSCAR